VLRVAIVDNNNSRDEKRIDLELIPIKYPPHLGVDIIHIYDTRVEWFHRGVSDMRIVVECVDDDVPTSLVIVANRRQMIALLLSWMILTIGIDTIEEYQRLLHSVKCAKCHISWYRAAVVVNRVFGVSKKRTWVSFSHWLTAWRIMMIGRYCEKKEIWILPQPRPGDWFFPRQLHSVVAAVVYPHNKKISKAKE
jgi:hypothetical protein